VGTRDIALAVQAPQAGADGELPREWQIFAAGVNQTLKGDLVFDAKSAASVMKSYARRGVDAWMDYEHERLSPPPGGAKASAWLDLAVRDGALWATNVRFTVPAAKALSNREFRYFSPLVRVDDKNRVVELINLALTNDPATLNQKPLIAASARERAEENEMKTVLVALGLAADVDEAGALSAITRLQGQLRDLLALSGKQTHAEAVGELAAWKASHGEVVALRARLADIEQATATAEFNAVLEQAGKDAKIPPAVDDPRRVFALSLRDRPDGLAMLKAFTASLPALVGAMSAKPLEPAPQGGDSKIVSFSRGEVEMAKALSGGRADKLLADIAAWRADGNTVRYGGFSTTDEDKEEARRITVASKG